MGPKGDSIAQQHHGFEFVGYTLDLDRAALIKDGVDQNLRPQVFDVLRYLVERSGSLVSKEELLTEIWGDKAVTDDSLTHCVIEIRKALHDTDRSIIRTVPRRGFVFDIPVRRHVPRQLAGSRRRLRPGPAYLIVVAVLAVAATYVLLPLVGNSDRDFETTNDVTDYYAQAQFLFQRRATGDLDAARDYFQKAIELDAQSAAAWAGLAGVYRILHRERPEQDNYLQKLKAAAEQAISLDPNNGAAWMRLAHYYHEIEDVQAAERAYASALRADPEDPLVLASTAGRMARNGDFRAAIDLERRALAAQPLSVVDRKNLAAFLFAAGDFDEAMHESRRAHQVRPATSERPDTLSGYALIKLERYEDALQLVREWPQGVDQCAVSAMAFHGLGREADVVRAIEHLRREGNSEALFRLAEVEAFTGRVDHSFARLTQMRDDLVRSVDSGAVDDWLFRLRLSPFLDLVRTDPRWKAWAQQTYDLAVAANDVPADD